jgi:hypothetical protein
MPRNSAIPANVQRTLRDTGWSLLDRSIELSEENGKAIRGGRRVILSERSARSVAATPVSVARPGIRSLSGTLRPGMKHRGWVVPVLAGLAVVWAAAIFFLRPSSRELRGDEGTYVAMAASLARDFDLRFGASDRAWAEERGGVALILQQTPRGLFYSKPILYPLLTAPFMLVSAAWGGALFNFAAFVAVLLVARRLLPAARGAEGRDALLTFAATGLPLVYLAWRMTESLQVSLALAGLALTLAAVRGGAGVRPELAGAALLGLLVSLREPNAMVAAVPVVAALVLGQPRRAVRLAGAIAVAYVALVALTWAAAGAPNPYKAARSTFNAETGYPVALAGEDGVSAAAALARFSTDSELATSTLGAVPRLDPRRSAYATIYFLVGRHTGLLWYLPAVCVLFVIAARESDRAGRVALAGFLALALFYLVWLPVNYFGGETFVGNRYILAGAALPLAALVRPPGRRALAFAWLIAAVTGASAMRSVLATRHVDATSQSHAHAGLFRLLPYESTASNLDGRRDRYWAGDFVRFVDPFADAAAWSFELPAGGRAAEVEIATRGDGSALHLLALADAPDVWLELSDWGERHRIRLAPHEGGGSGGPIRFEPSAAWRRHAYWWNEEALYRTRLVSFRALSADGRAATVRVRYLGRTPPPAEGFGRELVRLDLAGDAVAGATSHVTVELRNTGTWAWSSEAVLPVQLGLRLRRADVDAPPRDARRPLPATVRPGESVVTVFPIEWPREPGRYRVMLDLVLEDVCWFAEKVGEPLASAEVKVEPATTAAR